MLENIHQFLLKLTGKQKKSIMIVKGESYPGNYEILDKKDISEYRRRYTLKKGGDIYYLNVEDYRNADFMVDKFYSSTIVKKNTSNIKTVDTKNFKEL